MLSDARSARLTATGMRLVVALSIFGVISAPSIAAEPGFGIPKLSGGRVDARVTLDASSGISSFEYRLLHSGSQLRITAFSIDISSSTDRELMTGGDLSFVEPSGSASTELNLSRVGIGRFVPVGVASQPAGWANGVQPPAELAWGTIKETAGGLPGGTVAPFVATSRGLPGIRRATLDPDVFDFMPNPDEGNVDPVALIDAVKAASQELRTVGPVAPPKDFDPVEFAEYIASLRSEAATLGWVRSGADVSNVDSLLGQVRSQLASGEFGPAAVSAAAFISAVESASCVELDCPPERPMTAEARALLALNMGFLRDRIPVSVALETAPAHVWLGLKNSDDQGTQFDVRVALYAGDALVAEGVALCIAGVTRNAGSAKDAAIIFGPSAGSPTSGDTLVFKLSTRIGTNPDGTKCAGHSNAVGLRLYYDALSRPSRLGAGVGGGNPIDHFLHLNGASFTLDTNAPTASQAKQKDSPGLNFAGGNVWVEVGAWSMVVP